MALNRMPPELKEEIIEACDYASLLSLRLAGSREYFDANKNSFGNRFCVKRTHLYNNVGLRALALLTEHPVYSRYVRRLS